METMRSRARWDLGFWNEGRREKAAAPPAGDGFGTAASVGDEFWKDARREKAGGGGVWLKEAWREKGWVWLWCVCCVKAWVLLSWAGGKPCVGDECMGDERGGRGIGERGRLEKVSTSTGE